MKTEINGVEITPEMAEVLKSWYDYSPDFEISTPERYEKQLAKVQDCLTRILLNLEDVSKNTLESCLSGVICIKDDLGKFIPKKGGEA